MVTATERGIRNVDWVTNNRRVLNISQSNTLVARNILMSPLLVPALMQKRVFVCFTPGKALIVDADNLFDIIGQHFTRLMACFTSLMTNASCKRPELAPTIAQLNPSWQSRKSNLRTASVRLSERSATLRTLHRIRIIVLRQSRFHHLHPQTHRALHAVMNRTKESSPAALTEGIAFEIWPYSINEGDMAILKSAFMHSPVFSQSNSVMCSRSKYRRRFSGSLTRQMKLAKLHADTKGKISAESVEGHHSFLTAYDDPSARTVVESRALGTGPREVVE